MLFTQLDHIGGQLHMVMVSIVAGACLACVPRFSASRCWEEVIRLGSTYFGGFPSIGHILMGRPPSPQEKQTKLRCAILIGGSQALKEEFSERLGVPVLDSYGMTEAEPLALSQHGEAGPERACGRVSVDFEIAIVDENDLPMPVGEQGTIVFRPRRPFVMMQDYIGDSGATVNTWRNLWYHTNDIGRLDADNNLFFIERKSHYIRRRGENVSALEAEKIILAHSDVAEAVVVGVPSPMGEQDIKAVIVRKPDHFVSAEDLHSYCEAEMPRFMVPRYIEFRPDLPLTDAGKVNRTPLESIRDTDWDGENLV